MKEWFTVAEILSMDLPTLPSTYQALEIMARRNWGKNLELTRLIKGKTKPVREYHIITYHKN